jgi:hypothetical protein
MTYAVQIASPLVALLLLLIGLIVLTAVLIARPWRSRPAGLADQLRIGAAVARYDLWLELQGVGRRRRRDLREELRANLSDAAQRVGATEAVAALGSLRAMAGEATPRAGSGPRWSRGVTTAAFTFGAVSLAEMFAVVAWTSGAEASGATRAQGSLPFFPGSLATWERIDGGLSVGLEPGWLLLAAVALGFVLGSRAWLVRPQRQRAAG